MLIKKSFRNEVVIVANIEFLLNVWTQTEKEEFLLCIEKMSIVETNIIFIFTMQYDSTFENKEILTSKKDSRIIDINLIKTIGS